jgi:hypothetical protein
VHRPQVLDACILDRYIVVAAVKMRCLLHQYNAADRSAGAEKTYVHQGAEVFRQRRACCYALKTRMTVVWWC